jgi:hypothetical protein
VTTADAIGMPPRLPAIQRGDVSRDAGSGILNLALIAILENLYNCGHPLTI